MSKIQFKDFLTKKQLYCTDNYLSTIFIFLFVLNSIPNYTPNWHKISDGSNGYCKSTFFSIYSGVLRTLSNNYDATFWRKYLKLLVLNFSQKSSISYVWQCPMHASELYRFYDGLKAPHIIFVALETCWKEISP